MTVPTTRAEFKAYCLRRLGDPVIDINVDDEQIEDRIDEALFYFRDYHFDGSERILLKVQVDATDIANGYLTLPQTVIGVHSILDIGAGTAQSSSSLFNLNYQFRMNDFQNIYSASYVPYVFAMQHIATMQEMFVGKKPIRYNRHVNKLHIDMDWESNVSIGDYIIVDCYAYTDPDEYADVWGDRWLSRYATALIKRQWGDNMSKFEGMQLPGGVQFSGRIIREEAQTELDKLEEEMIVSYSLPINDMIG